MCLCPADALVGLGMGHRDVVVGRTGMVGARFGGGCGWASRSLSNLESRVQIALAPNIVY